MNSPLRRARTATLAVTMVIGLAGAAAVAAPAHGSAPQTSGAGPITVLTFNMCGEHCSADSTNADVTALMARIDKYQPGAVLLQEMCGDQFAALAALAQQPGHWALSGFRDVTETRGCDSGNDTFGDAIFLHAPTMPVGFAEKSLKYVHGKGANRQTRKVLCVFAQGTFPRDTTVCTVHAGLAFEIGVKHQATQIKQAYDFARKQSPTSPMIFGGDFNVTPSSNALDRVYFDGGGGAFGAMQEADRCSGPHGRAHHTKQCNAFTHDATPQIKHRTKNDFIFGSRKSFKSLHAVVNPSKYSDHDALLGRIYMCSSGIC